MAIPNQTIVIQDPGLGLVEPAQNIPLFMGASSIGTNDAVVQLEKIGDVETEFGEGPLVEFLTRQLLVSGGPVLAMKLDASVVGINSAVTASGGGPTVSLANSPFDSYVAVITIVAGGILGTATFTYTLDGGTSLSGVITVPAGGTFDIPNTNIEVTFAAGTYVADETYSWTSTEPQNNLTDISAGYTALALLNVTFDYITMTTTFTDATGAAAAFVNLTAQAATLFNAFEFTRILVDAGPDNAATTITAFAAAESTRVSPCFSTTTAPSGKPFVGRTTRVSSTALEASIQAGIQLISTDLARVDNGKLGGEISAVTAIGFNAENDSSLDTAKFTTTRTWKGRIGFFFTNVRFKSPAGSDFVFWQHGRIIDEASEVVQVAQQGFIGKGVRTGTNGVIDERDAVGLETDVNTPLNVVLTSPANVEGFQGHVTAFQYQIDRTNDVLATSTIISELRIKPFGYIKFITTTIGFSATLGAEEEESE